MAFSIYKTDDGRVLPYEYLPASAIALEPGMALKLTSGKLAKCGATDMPLYISMMHSDAAVADGSMVPVVRVQPDVIFVTTSTAALTSVNPGDKVQLNANALEITATKTTGVAEIVGMDGTAVGDRVFVRFNTPASA